MDFINEGEITSPKSTLTNVEEKTDAAKPAKLATESVEEESAAQNNITGAKQPEMVEKSTSNEDAITAPAETDVHETANQESESGQMAGFAQFAPGNFEEDADESVLSQTPFLPDSVFTTLPALLKDSCEKFESKRERDIYFTSALCILSGCFSTVSGEYGQRTVYPNLYSFIIAPPASGKGVMTNAKQLGGKIHSKLVEESNDLKKKYDQEFKAYKQLQKKSKQHGTDATLVMPPVVPPFKTLFIPADISASRLVDHLVANGGTGIFCETEADTVAQSLNQEWGKFSDKLRKAFHHEAIAYSRKAESTYMEVDCPRLSLVITGTPSQIAGVIKSAGDGLSSRMLFYTFKGRTVWKPAFPKNKVNLTEYFDKLAGTVDTYSEKLSQSEIKFSLSVEQGHALDKVFTKWLKECSIIMGEDAEPTVIRLGLILFRIAMVLSTLKRAESGDIGAEMVCTDTDFNAALALTQVYKEHAFVILGQLPKRKDKMSANRMKFYNALPSDKTFRRAEAIEVGKGLGLKERAVANYVAAFLEGGLLEYPEAKIGTYKKVHRQTLPTMQSK